LRDITEKKVDRVLIILILACWFTVVTLCVAVCRNAAQGDGARDGSQLGVHRSGVSHERLDELRAAETQELDPVRGRGGLILSS